ncbi:MAG TPA: potassium transporter TrkG [Bacteroidales bacterium]|nr:potassium transporter TrkG [Bacteroidales bacterium]HPB24834.1 potassium transporter TrkG [Bacteroidales bacterium]HPI29714.1 potassium transporter TrkG [Bacteroidales bacterium]HQN15691.1 potassium transporter TrkG [Bacteroidales bacterium]HQP15152.1 potassium transporter TrkG [Bacteroidales bacterium]
MSDSRKDFSERTPKDTIHKWFQITSFVISFLAVLLIFIEIGFPSPQISFHNLEKFYIIALFLLLLSTLVRYTSFRPKKQKTELWILDILFFMFSIILIIKKVFLFNATNEWLAIFDHRLWIYLLLFYAFFKEISLFGPELFSRRFNPALIFVISFLLMIIVGSLLLLLPNATTSGISFIDSLFTSTSAVCVTGLTVLDTGKDFTLLGQIIILFLIQAGGVGIMTFTSYFSYFFKGKSTFHSQLMLSDLANSETLSELFVVLKRIIFVTFIIEAAGALIIYTQLPENAGMSLSEKIFFSVFHSISGFCNAGISTLSDGFQDLNFLYNYPFLITMSVLIIAGGLGFPIIFNFLKYLRHLIVNRIFRLNKHREYIHKAWVININTRIVVVTTVIIILAGTLIVFIMEYNRSLQDHGWAGKLVTAFFNISSHRTAGFNSIDFSVVQVPVIFLIMLLMWIGASPGSTGGGIKTTTFAISILNFISLAKGKDRVEVFHRQVADSSLRRASAIIMLSFIVIGLAVFLVSFFDPEEKLLDVVFECFSAYGTAGLSLGLTPNLSEASKLVISITMFLGRLGTLTVLIAFFKKIQHTNYHYPTENILIN